MQFFIIFIIAFVVSVFITPIVRSLAYKSGVVAHPAPPRRLHTKAVPLFGGVAVFASLALAVLIALAADWLPGEHIKTKHVIGLLIAVALLVLGGALDDKYELPPRLQILWPVLAALTVITSGIGITNITNPFGGQIRLDDYVFTAMTWQGIPYKITLLADLFTLAWLMGTTYTTKLLDGLDGLVSGVAVIGGLIIAAVSFMKNVSQPDTAILAFAVTGAFLGFLLYNFHPASIFLGEGGSTLAGFLLGTLAIISGGKIATTLLILGLPLFDALIVVLRRSLFERRSPVSADRSHLHFRLLEYGFSHRQAVLFFYAVAAVFGSSTLFFRGWEKVASLVLLFLVLLTVLGAGVFRARKAT